MEFVVLKLKATPERVRVLREVKAVLPMLTLASHLGLYLHRCRHEAEVDLDDDARWDLVGRP